jgi:hypothetical protein
MTMQEMTLGKVIEALEALLDDFSFRSGGGDGKVITDAVYALQYLKNQKDRMDTNSAARKLEETAIYTGRAEPVLKLFELMKYELLVLSLEEIELFAPHGSEARELASQILVHLRSVRQVLGPYYMQEVTW